MNSPVIIVLATFNGAHFLSEQLDSLIARTETHWTLIIRDDGSTDETLQIIQSYSDNDSRIHLLLDKEKNCETALGIFFILLDAAFANDVKYVFCCDQDDVWEPNKLEVVLTRLKQLEGECKDPCLVHHDLLVVDEPLNTVNADPKRTLNDVQYMRNAGNIAFVLSILIVSQ